MEFSDENLLVSDEMDSSRSFLTDNLLVAVGAVSENSMDGLSRVLRSFVSDSSALGETRIIYKYLPAVIAVNKGFFSIIVTIGRRIRCGVNPRI